jgi:hypothetical protein
VAAKGGERSVKGRNLSAISARQAKQIPIRNLLSGLAERTSCSKIGDTASGHQT